MRHVALRLALVCCSLGLAGRVEAQVTKTFKITGNSTGVGWSFAIIKNGSLYCQGVVPTGTVPNTADCNALTTAFINQLRLRCELADMKYRIDPGPDPCTFTIKQFNHDTLQFWVGAETGNPASGCQVTNNPAGCAFNPLIEEITSPGIAVCFGDGTGAACPCGNQGGPGAGCASAFTGDPSGVQCVPGPMSVGTTLTAGGSNSLGAQADPTTRLVLTANDTTTQPGLFFSGVSVINGGNGVVFGDGLRCCGGSLRRLQLLDLPPQGAGVNCPATGSTSVDLTAVTPGTVLPGVTLCYQYWYRNPNRSHCGLNFNLSSAMTVAWVP